MPRWILATFGALPLVALVLHRLAPGGAVEGWLDAWFALHCHQDPSRTLRVAGQAFPVCARCTGIYLGLLAGALYWLPVSRRTWLVLAGVGAALLGLDLATQAAGLRVSSLATRFGTGFLFSLPLAAAAQTHRRPPSAV